MVSVCLPSDALFLYLPSYLGFSYLGHGISLHGCSSKAQPLLLTLDEGYLLSTAIPDLQHGIAPLGPPAPAQPPLLRLLLPASGMGGSSQLPPLASGARWLLPADPDLRRGVSPPSLHCPRTRGSSSRPFLHHRSLALWAAVPDFRCGVAPG